jgi:glutathione S-transferase
MFMPLKLYQSDLSPFATRVRVLAAAKGLKLECVAPPGGSLKSSEYLAINPLGKVPCLDHDGVLLPESETICEYLEDKFPSPTLRPVDAQVRARVRLLSRLGDIYIAPPLFRLLGQLNPKTRDAAAVDLALAESGTALGSLGHFLEGSDYAVGERLSLADCTLAPLLFFFDALIKLTFGRGALAGKVEAYYAGVQNDPHVARGLGEMKLALAERLKKGFG